MVRIIRLADRLIEIESQHDQVMDFLASFQVKDIAERKIDFSVLIAHSDIEYERKKQEKERSSVDHGEAVLSDLNLEMLAIHRKIAEQIPRFNTILFHASSIMVEGEVYLFTAPSGTGKSTHTRLWREILGARAVMVNDDKPMIHVPTAEGAKAIVYGTPWNGKHHLGSNISAPLKAICVLERAQENRISEISWREVFPELLQSVYRPMDREQLIKTLEIVDHLKNKVRFYRLGCNMERESAWMSYHAMKGQGNETE